MRTTYATLTVAALTLGAVGNVSAADIPTKAPAYKAPATVVADRWSGWYAGAHIGGGWSDADFGDPSGAFIPAGTTVGNTGSAFLGGVQLGFNWQVASWVWGVQGDISFTDLQPSVQSPIVPTSGIDVNTKWITTLTGRVGYAWDQSLLYAKGGVAWARNHYAVNDPTLGINAVATDTRVGWVAGAGWEYAFAPNWSGFIEYNYLDFGKNDNITLVDPVLGTTPLNADQQIHVVKAGLNYRFSTWLAGR